MLPSAAHLVLGAVALAAAFVFVVSYRFALRESAEARELACQPDIPRAVIRRADPRWLSGSPGQRALGAVRVVQAGFIAVGITSIFVMTVCAVGIVGLAIFS